jgi:hypothetical protein
VGGSDGWRGRAVKAKTDTIGWEEEIDDRERGLCGEELS